MGVDRRAIVANDSKQTLYNHQARPGERFLSPDGRVQVPERVQWIGCDGEKKG